MTLQRSVLTLLVISCGARAYAAAPQEPKLKGAQEEDQVVKATSDPITFHRTLEVEPEYTGFSSGGWSYSQTQRLLIPFGHQEGIYGIARLEAPFIGENAPEVTGWGLEDFKLIGGAAIRTGFGALALGADFSFPSATQSAFGNGNWSFGPGGAVTVRSVEGYRFGLLLQQYFPLFVEAGRKSESYLWVQPTVVKYLPQNFFLIFNPILKFDWWSASAIVPLDLGFGMGLSQSISLYLQPEVVVSGSDNGNWSIKAKLSAIDW